MNNLHRELAPVSDDAWTQIEQEVARTFKRHLAGRRVVDVHGPTGASLAAIGTGRQRDIDPPAEGVRARQNQVAQLVELRVPFAVSRRQVDDVERGAQDADWQPAKDAAKRIAFAEDGAICDGYPGAGIEGLRPASSNPSVPLPGSVQDYPEAIAQAVSLLRVAGVDGPYSVLLSADGYTAVSEATHHGYPVLEHIQRLLSGEILWAPAISGAIALSTRGGDFCLQLGQDLSIGYQSHTDSDVQLYLQETMTFQAYTSEAVVTLTANGG
jgi:uncharacterized linocin/CFP29 family protein